MEATKTAKKTVSRIMKNFYKDDFIKIDYDGYSLDSYEFTIYIKGKKPFYYSLSDWDVKNAWMLR